MLDKVDYYLFLFVLSSYPFSFEFGLYQSISSLNS